MKTAFWQASLTASQAGESSHTNGFEHTIESSILTDLILRKTAALQYLRLLGILRAGRWARMSTARSTPPAARRGPGPGGDALGIELRDIVVRGHK
jgi:hypothetical protein